MTVYLHFMWITDYPIFLAPFIGRVELLCCKVKHIGVTKFVSTTLPVS